MLNFDPSLCTRCGLCVQICPDAVIALDSGASAPRAAQAEFCERCGHCVSVCPADAIRHDELPAEDFQPVTQANILQDDMADFLLSKRSARQFEDRPVEKDLLERLINVAHFAPTDNNSQARGFVVVTDRGLLERLEKAVVDYFSKLLKMLPWPVRKAAGLVMPGEISELEKILPSLREFVRRGKAGEPLVFRNAPCAVFIHGPKGNTLSRDNCIAAQHYLMLQAHAMGLGSCIIGYATTARSVLEKELDLPRGERMYAVSTLGYPQIDFRKVPARKSAKVVWR